MALPGAKGAAKLTADQFERIGRALAHVVLINEGVEVVLGQAWLAATGTLVTCGHVVDQFVGDPGALVVKFPSSGKSYQVRKIKLHPNFTRQPDHLVKFDLAVLSVELSHPELHVRPLSFAYECPFEKDQTLVAIRFPVHLGALSDAPEPIVQDGKILGHLHKQDDFHWLHDLALAPGDSGTALFDGPNVVAIHCGDTATLPGLNLPTTAIRLALWIDALKEIGLSETASTMFSRRTRPLVSAAFGLVAAMFFTFLVTAGALFASQGGGWSLEAPSVKPVDVRFNEPVLGYKPGEQVTIDLIPRTDCNLYLFFVDGEGHVNVVHPLPGFSAMVKADQKRSISEIGGRAMHADKSPGKLQLVALISNDPLVKETDWSKEKPAESPLTIDADALKARIQEFEKFEPDNILYIQLDAPRAL